MNRRVSLSLAAAALLCGATANAACPPGQPNGCTKVDLSVLPQITDQIVAREAIVPAVKKTSPADPETQPYTGPTVGVSDHARRAPMVGYRWSTD